MGIEITKGRLEGVRHIIPPLHRDERGYFIESYSKKDFTECGITNDFIQENESKSKKGVLRGLHYQTKHVQAKLVRCIYGMVLDVAVDLRRNSATFGKWESVILDGGTKNMMYIPEGFAHGFLVISDEALVMYKCSNYYDPYNEGGVRFDDPTIGIDWRLGEFGISQPVLSEKDLKLPCFNKDLRYF